VAETSAEGETVSVEAEGDAEVVTSSGLEGSIGIEPTVNICCAG
jgi:hypothetical protein